MRSHHIDLKPKKHHSSKTNHHHSHSQNRFITGNVLNTDPHLGATNGSGFVPNLSSKKTTSERDFERIRLKQEQERRYKLCAEHEKSLRERTNRQSSLKQSQNNDALKKFYENKAREFGLMNCTRNQQSSKAPSFSKNLPENSEPSLQIRSTPKKNDSRSARDLVERIKSGYKIVKFIKYHITRLKTQRILSKLCKLRTFENHLISLKSTNNNDINSLKDPILKILEQLDQISSGDSEVVIARKNQIVKMAQNMMGSLNEKCLNINYSLDVY
ncbi:23590_t:CDS:2 [Dentiscutata erythropus]|uniref:23590_t:CDS:1 n=1 Tax=Dentiscutata erythropus TaxID=1348616 RepID=A0A9N9CDG3_9GLOM|nr:23590_t:CDS:2 [Dentiscutata erythropus]